MVQSKKKNGSPRSRRIKPTSRQESFVRLRDLKCFAEAHDRLAQGWPCPEVARFIQDLKGEYTNVTRVGLINILKNYRKTIPAAELAMHKVPKDVQRAVELVEEGMDELVEMQKLYRLQMNRVDIDMQTEAKINKLLPSMTQEIRTAREILNNYAQLKMDLGLSKRQLGKLDVDARVVAEAVVRYGDTVGEVIQNPESRRKVLGLAQRLLASAAKEVRSEKAAEAIVIDAVGTTVEPAE
jgi:hypothetical protein